MKKIHVVGAVIINEGRVFCTQRGSGALAGYWEFPGGKLEPDESPEDALVREIDEELTCTVSVEEKVVTTTHIYDFGEVTLTTFYCALSSGTPTLSEHSDSRWMHPEELHLLSWAPADVPAVEQVQRDLSDDR
ncbi:MAG: (deoxy)nucleoside triphosphate pyrophosphohydrolase [Propionicimonas sp.]